MKAVHIQNGSSLDYKNTGDSPIKTGQIVVLGSKVAVAACDIPVGGSGAVEVGQVWGVSKDSAEITLGAKVYYKVTDDVFTATAEGNVEAGYAVEAASASATTVKVKLLA